MAESTTHIYQMGDNIVGVFSGDPINNIWSLSISGYGAMFADRSSFYAADEYTTGSFGARWARCVDTSLVIPDGITTIADNCFSISPDRNYINSVKTIYVGNSVVDVGWESFRNSNDPDYRYNDDVLEYIYFTNPSILQRIKDRAFEGRIRLKQVYFGGYTPINLSTGEQDLGDWLFNNCRSLEVVDFGTHLHLTNAMFSNCWCLHHFNSDNSIKSFEHTVRASRYGILRNCFNLTRLYFDETAIFDANTADSAYFDVDLSLLSNEDFDYFDTDTWERNYIDSSSGCMITRITHSSTWCICHDWKNIEHRILLDDRGKEYRRPFLAINCYDGSLLTLPVYPTPPPEKIDNYFCVNDYQGYTWYVLHSRTMQLSSTPLVVNRDNKQCFVTYSKNKYGV